MRIPHKDRTHHKQMQLASAADVAARLPVATRLSGGWYRTQAICHGGDAPDSLAFRDSDHKGGGLHVHCHSGHCDPIAILHAIQEATSLQVCRCDDCWAAWRTGEPQKGAQGGTGRHKRITGDYTTKTTQNGAQEGTGSDTAAYAAKLWAAAAVSTGKAPEHHPVSRWLADKAPGGLWPPDVPLPEAVRWLPREKMPAGKDVQSDSKAAGAVVLAMRRLDAPLLNPRKVHLVAIDAQGRKTQHWRAGDKRTYGADAGASGLLWRIRPGAGVIFDLHICEGLADGLRVLRYAGDPAIVAVCAGTGYGGLQPGWFRSVTLWPDADGAGLQAAERAGQRWANLGYEVNLIRLAPGHDPASAPLTGDPESGKSS